MYCSQQFVTLVRGQWVSKHMTLHQTQCVTMSPPRSRQFWVVLSCTFVRSVPQRFWVCVLWMCECFWFLWINITKWNRRTRRHMRTSMETEVESKLESDRGVAAHTESQTNGKWWRLAHKIIIIPTRHEPDHDRVYREPANAKTENKDDNHTRYSFVTSF